MTLAWTPPEQNGGTLEAYEYAIAEGYQGHYSQWREIPLGDITTDTTDANAPESSYIVTGLHAYAVYRFSVREVNEHGKAETSTGIAHRVSVDPCGTYLTYNLLADPADSQATLSWTVIPDPAETITKFQYRQKRGTGEWDPWHDIPYNNPSGPNSKTYTVTGLTNCKTYSFQVRAIYDIGSANDSNNTSAKPTAESAVTFDSGVVPLTVLENTPAGGDIGGPITATGGSCPPISYSLSGVNAGSFDIVAESGQLQTQAALDYETKSSYTVTVTASDGTLTAAVDVTVTVTNIDEAGTVTLSTNQPPARAEITAALTDPDEGVTGAVWQWERSSDGNTGWAGIGTSSPSYTPVDGDVGYHLRARASYTDGHGPGKTAQAASTLAVQAGANRPPKFDSATATREVPENTEEGGNIGAPVTANDPDSDTLTYTLGGTDANFFDIDTSTGQLQTKAALDHETRNSYTVTVTATDPSNATGEVTVTITVTDEDEGGSVTLSSPQPRVSSELSATLNDPDAGVTRVTWQWASTSTAQGTYVNISVATSASYTPVAGDVGKFLRATASYTDKFASNKNAQAVSAAVQAAPPPPPRQPAPPPSNAAPESPGTPATRTVAENTAAGVNIGNPIAATDPDSDTLTYSLRGVDAGSFDIVAESGQLQTKAALDHETRNSYTVTVTATDPSNATGEVTVTITVTDEDEGGSVTLSSPQPRVSSELSATLNDPDAGVTRVTWQWASTSTAQGTYVNISVATSASYTPVAGDVGKFLRATASYTDKFASNKNAQAVSAAVQAAPPPPPRQPAPAPPPSNAAPEFPGTPATRTVAENTAAGVNIGNPIAATDPDSDTLTYSLRGVDAGSFDIVAESGQLQTKAALDHETRNSYTVTVSVHDGKADDGSPNEEPDDTITVTITVTDVDEPPGKPDAPTVGPASTNGHNTLTVS